MQFLPRRNARLPHPARADADQTEALPIVLDLTHALSAAHQAEVVHRDFKSGNVMLVPGPRSHQRGGHRFWPGARPTAITSPKSQMDMAGTVDYMAPEQLRGEEITPAGRHLCVGRRDVRNGHRRTTLLRRPQDSRRAETSQ